MENLLTEQEVKEKLGITDFRHLSKSQVISFVSSIPNMQKDVAIACINQFSNFKEYSIIIVKHYYDLCNKALESDSNASIEAYKSIVDSMNMLLKSGDTSEETKQLIIHQIVVIAEKLENREDKQRLFKTKVLQTAGALGAFAITVAGSLLGVKIIKK